MCWSFRGFFNGQQEGSLPGSHSRLFVHTFPWYIQVPTLSSSQTDLFPLPCVHPGLVPTSESLPLLPRAHPCPALSPVLLSVHNGRSTEEPPRAFRLLTISLLSPAEACLWERTRDTGNLEEGTEAYRAVYSFVLLELYTVCMYELPRKIIIASI